MLELMILQVSRNKICGVLNNCSSNLSCNITNDTSCKTTIRIKRQKKST